MRSNSIKTADTYKWMLAAHSRTEKHGGFKTAHMHDCRGYSGIQVAARQLGYIVYHRSQFKWIGEKPTMTMAELLAYEYHICREDRMKQVAEDSFKATGQPPQPNTVESFGPVIIGEHELRVPPKVSFWGLPTWMKRKPKVDTVLRVLTGEILKECLAIKSLLAAIPSNEKLEALTDKISELLEPEGAFDEQKD